MNLPMIRITILALTSLLFAACAPQPGASPDLTAGEKAADRDIAAGRLIYLDNRATTNGKKDAAGKPLKGRYGVRYRVDRSRSDEYAKGYNARVDQEAQLRFNSYVGPKLPDSSSIDAGTMSTGVNWGR